MGKKYQITICYWYFLSKYQIFAYRSTSLEHTIHSDDANPIGMWITLFHHASAPVDCWNKLVLHKHQTFVLTMQALSRTPALCRCHTDSTYTPDARQTNRANNQKLWMRSEHVARQTHHPLRAVHLHPVRCSVVQCESVRLASAGLSVWAAASQGLHHTQLEWAVQLHTIDRPLPPASCPPPPPRCRSQLIVNAQSDLSHWQRGRPLCTHVRRVWRGWGALHHMGGGTGGGGGAVPSNFSAFNIMPMGVAWKESTSNGPRAPPPNRRALAPPLHCAGWTGVLLCAGCQPMPLKMESSSTGAPAISCQSSAGWRIKAAVH